MRKKTKILLISYLSVLILTLALYAWAGQWGLGWYRRTANESASLAYEETVRSVQTLSAVLAQAPYATEAEMCDRVCCEAYACAAAAESAMSTLPFSTWELEQLSGFLNTAGDYAHALCGQGQPFSEKQRRELGELADSAADFSDTLLDLREQLHRSDVRMDSREKRLRNVGEEPGVPLSGELGAYEAGFRPVSLRYDGQYGAEEEKSSSGLLTEEEMLAAAANFLGVEPSELEQAYRSESGDSRRCYRAGDCWLTVGRGGVESMTASRLVGEEKLSLTQARAAARRILRERGYEDLTLLREEQKACLALFTFARSQDEALCPDCVLRLTIALDDGSLYAFDASDFDSELYTVRWEQEEDDARETLPTALRDAECRPMILRSPGGEPVPCYVFTAQDEEGKQVEIAVRADTGSQYRIRVG